MSEVANIHQKRRKKMKGAIALLMLLVSTFFAGGDSIAANNVIMKSQLPEVFFEEWGDVGEQYMVTVSLKNSGKNSVGVFVNGDSAILARPPFFSGEVDVVLPEIGKKYLVEVVVYDEKRNMIGKRSETFFTSPIKFSEEDASFSKIDGKVVISFFGHKMTEKYSPKKIEVSIGQKKKEARIIPIGHESIIATVEMTENEWIEAVETEEGLMPANIHVDGTHTKVMIPLE